MKRTLLPILCAATLAAAVSCGGNPENTTADAVAKMGVMAGDAFSSNQYGLANAEGLIFFLFIFTITSLQFYLSRKKEASLS